MAEGVIFGDRVALCIDRMMGTIVVVSLGVALPPLEVAYSCSGGGDRGIIVGGFVLGIIGGE